MIYLRSTLFALFLLIFTPIWSVLCMLAFPFLSPENRYKFIGIWNKVVIWLLWHLCGIHYEIRGMEYMRAVLDKPVVILSKHQSAWETLAFQAIFPTQVYVLKRELLWIPIFGWGLAMSSPIAIDRSAGREADGERIVGVPPGIGRAVGHDLTEVQHGVGPRSPAARRGAPQPARRGRVRGRCDFGSVPTSARHQGPPRRQHRRAPERRGGGVRCLDRSARHPGHNEWRSVGVVSQRQDQPRRHARQREGERATQRAPQHPPQRHTVGSHA